MTQHLHEQYEGWIGRTLNDGAGHKIGKVDDIYTDDDTGQPEWLAVTTGLFGSNMSFVPLAGATAAGDDLQVQFPKDQVKDAPNAGGDGKLSQAEEARLYAHYGLDYDQERVRLQRWLESERAETTVVDPGDRMATTGPGRMTAVDEVPARPTLADPDEARTVTEDEVLARRRGGDPVEARPVTDDEMLARHGADPVGRRPMTSPWAEERPVDGELDDPWTDPVEAGGRSRGR